MKYYLIAGEASGDLHGANLIEALKKKNAAIEIRAWGGSKMERKGATIVKHYKELAFMGFWEVAKNLRTILSNISFCKKDILKFQPDALILIDYPGFNMRIAKWAKQKKIPVHYYIMPQVWAWKENRVKKLAKDTDYRYAILPFEVDFFQKKHSLDIDFVGHPLLDELSSRPPVDEVMFRKELGVSNDQKIIALLPGSRKQEIRKLLSVMNSVKDQFPDYTFVIAGTSAIEKSLYNEFAPNVPIVIDQTYALVSSSKAALVTSGTATLETALLKIPQVVCYITSPLSYAIAKCIVSLSYISLVNLIMNRLLVEELIQKKCNPKELSRALGDILSKKGRAEVISGYNDLIAELGGEGASEKTASLIHQRSHA